MSLVLWLVPLTAAVVAVTLAGLVVLSPAPALAPKAPRALDLAGRPDEQLLTARDGTPLAYREYRPDRATGPVVVLVHGSGVDSRVVHRLAVALQADGCTVYTPDVRGHGGSGRRGDIDHLGQLDEDLDDLVELVDAAHPGAERVLVGFSAGGAFVLRIAASDLGDRFDRFVLLSPALPFPSPVARRGTGGWAAPRLPRIVGLLVLNRLGVHRFDGLEAISFAVHPDEPWTIGHYSFRLAMTFACPHHVDAMRRVQRPISLVAGADDDQFHADRYAAEFRPAAPDLDVRLVDGLGHVDLILDDRGIDAVRAAVGSSVPLPR